MKDTELRGAVRIIDKHLGKKLPNYYAMELSQALKTVKEFIASYFALTKEVSKVCEEAPRAIILLRYSDKVVLVKDNIKFTVHIDNNGNLVGKKEQEVKM